MRGDSIVLAITYFTFYQMSATYSHTHFHAHINTIHFISGLPWLILSNDSQQHAPQCYNGSFFQSSSGHDVARSLLNEYVQTHRRRPAAAVTSFSIYKTNSSVTDLKSSGWSQHSIATKASCRSSTYFTLESSIDTHKPITGFDQTAGMVEQNGGWHYLFGLSHK
mgnify:CR=1 FL=1